MRLHMYRLKCGGPDSMSFNDSNNFLLGITYNFTVDNPWSESASNQSAVVYPPLGQMAYGDGDRMVYGDGDDMVYGEL